VSPKTDNTHCRHICLVFYPARAWWVNRAISPRHRDEDCGNFFQGEGEASFVDAPYATHVCFCDSSQHTHTTHTPHTHTHTHTPNTMALSHPVRAHDDDDDDGDGGGDAWVIASGRGMTRAGTDETYYYVYSLSQLQSNESFFRDVFRDADDVRSVPSSAC
jgi:hypothetical protein